MTNTRMWRSLRAAWNGFKDVMVHEHTFRKMTVAALVVIGLMFLFPTTRNEKAILLIMVFAVLTLELINSVIERIMDFVHIERHDKVGEIKDLMAAIVLTVSVAAVSVGLVIFWPYLTSYQ